MTKLFTREVSTCANCPEFSHGTRSTTYYCYQLRENIFLPAGPSSCIHPRCPLPDVVTGPQPLNPVCDKCGHDKPRMLFSLGAPPYSREHHECTCRVCGHGWLTPVIKTTPPKQNGTSK